MVSGVGDLTQPENNRSQEESSNDRNNQNQYCRISRKII
ncbi:hypothetical protein PL8927_380007 [Planktothrix serta PCC 8927]|uniref:Uncharacterized protein n=1 Tax=Planktothrix serta PCC 8927 TaxID=671068 RepID=A0A7Z9BIR9_9CYAN|nr:hypothetical protein PL8927_380007 [Planktothrix serta PCC 8927]